MPYKDKEERNRYMREYRKRPKCYQCNCKAEGIYNGFSEFTDLTTELLGKPLCSHHMAIAMFREFVAAGREEMKTLNRIGYAMQQLGVLEGDTYNADGTVNE